MTNQRGRKRNILRRIGIVGPPLAALTILDKLDVLITFNKYVDIFLSKWHIWIALLWNSLLRLFGIDEITKIDAVFFTFFLMLFLSFLTSYSMEDQNARSSQRAWGVLAAIVGVMLIAGIFTIADIKTYEIDPEAYLSSFQYKIYYFYKEMLHTRSIPANDYTVYISFGLIFGFYFLVSLLIWVISLILAKIIGVRVHIWKLSRRMYFVIGLVGAVLVVNRVLFWLNPYLE